jgi:hypothetical protein
MSIMLRFVLTSSKPSINDLYGPAQLDRVLPRWRHVVNFALRAITAPFRPRHQPHHV